jgi:cytochrome c-type biogenesis protein CcmF
MIVELGHYALILALFVALVQAAAPLTGAATGNRALMALAGPAAQAQLLCLLIAFAVLMHAYIVSDFSVANVAENSHSAKPLIYKISGVWGNHEGSMLLWVTVMALYGAAVASFGHALPERLKARVLGIQGMLGSGIITFVLFTSNPFQRLSPAPFEGHGLNPLLQDPGLAIHPPMLYMGYVGFSLTFSFAIAALLEGRVDPAWARWVRPWALAAWSFLTAGIALGSWWAYYDLGWGGWWFWDPVENASFMPWLAGTALIHSAIVVEKRDALKRWTVLLAIITFGLSLIGTFLVRSGVLTSVHAFAVDPARGLFILVLLIAVIGGGLLLYALRAAKLESGGLFQPISREGALVLNNLLLATATATVFLGTLYPLFLDAVGGGTVSVGPPYFDATFIPLMTPLFIAVSIGPLLAWKRADLGAALVRLKWAAAASVAVALATWYVKYGGPVLAIGGMAVAAWLIVGAFVSIAERIRLFGDWRGAWHRAIHLPRASWGMTIAHAGLGIAILGMTGSLWRVEDIRAMRPGDDFPIGPYLVHFTGTATVPGPNYSAEEGRFSVTRGGGTSFAMTPSKRRFTDPPQVVANTAIHTTGLSDLYLVLGDADAAAGTWAVRAYYNPLIPLLWGGAGIMMLGGFLSLSDRRLRIGAAVKRPDLAGAVARG